MPQQPRTDAQAGQPSAPPRPWDRWTGDSPALLLISALLVLVPLIPVSLDSPRWHGLRTAIFEAGAGLLPLFLVAQAGRRWRRLRDSLRTWPVRLLLALLAWGVLSFALAPARPYAAQGVVLLASGLLVVLAASLARTRPRYQLLLSALTAASLLTSFSGFAFYGKDRTPLAQGLFHDHMLYGAALLLPLPMLLGVSLSPVTQARRLTAQAALVCGVVALGLAGTRSAWIGAVAAGVTFGGLVLYARRRERRGEVTSGERHRRRVQAAVSGAAVAVAVLYFLVAAPVAGLIGNRLHSLTTRSAYGQGSSVEWRFTAWRGALRMAGKKPLLGWGIGCYPRYQEGFTGTGRNPAQLAASGPTIFDEAHNSYLQLLVEEGVPGLLLWLGVLGSAFALGVPAVRRFAPRSLRQRVLMGCLSALAGQAVDSAANPGWQFGEVSVFFWVTLGLTVALSLGVPEAGDEAPPGPPLVSAFAVIAALAAGAGMLWAVWQTAQVLPAPTL